MKLILNFFLKILKIQILMLLIFGSIIIKSQIFDNELNGNISNRDYTQERVDLSSINGPMPGRLPNLITPGPGISSEDSSQFEGIRLEDVNSFTVDKNKPSENGGESPLFKEPVRPTRMLPINTASELQDDYNNFKMSLNKINLYFKTISKDSNLKKCLDNKDLINSKQEYIDNYVYNAIVNKAYSSYWEFIKTTIEKLPLKEDLHPILNASRPWPLLL